MKPQQSPADTKCAELLSLLSDYLDGSLDPALVARLERHLKHCPPCQAFLASLRRTVEWCHRNQVDKLSPEVAARTRALLLEECRRAMKGAPPRKRPPKPRNCSNCE